MKKVLAFILAFSMVFCLAGCKNNDPNEYSNRGPQKESFIDLITVLSKVTVKKTSVNDTGLLAYAKGDNGLYGYVNVFGNFVISPSYYSANIFDGDYATVTDSKSNYILIDRTGWQRLSSYGWQGLSASNHYKDGLMRISVSSSYPQRYIYLNENFSSAFNGYTFYQERVSGRWYPDGEKFGMASPFNLGKAVVMLQKNSDISDNLGLEQAFIVDKKGNIVARTPRGLDPTEIGIDDNGMIIVKNTDNYYGLCDITGRQIIDCTYSFIRHCEGSLYCVCNEKGFWGYMNSKGELVVDFKYQNALPFSEGLAAVYDGKYWGFIDETGKLAIESIFDEVAALKAENYDVSGFNGAFSNGIAAVKKDGYWSIIDANEKPIFVIDKNYCLESCPFVGVANGLITYSFTKDGITKYGVVSTEGKLVIEPKFSELGIFN